MKQAIQQLAEIVGRGYVKNNPTKFKEIRISILRGLENCFNDEDRILFLEHYKAVVKKDMTTHNCTMPDGGCMVDQCGEIALGLADELIEEIKRDEKERNEKERDEQSTNQTFGNVTVSGGTGITINFGTIRDISTNIHALELKGNDDISQALNTLTSAVNEATELANQDKTDLLELLKLVSEEAIKPKEERMKPIAMKSIITGGLSVLNTLSSVSTVTGKTIDQLLAYFQ